MKLMSARRVISAGIVAAASAAAFVVPSAASALPGHCEGTSTEGAGSSLQAEAQGVWDPGFSANKSVGCVGGPTVSYHSIGSGAGYKEWFVSHNFGKVGFVGTDNTVNGTEKEGVENEVTNKEVATSKLLTIPVLQGAVAIVVNLPAGCTANNSKFPGRLAFDQSTLEGIYGGSIKTWKELTEVPGTTNTISGEGCSLSSAILPVVRKDSSGTTHIFKKFLNLSDKSLLASEDGKEHTWAELGEGSLSKTWPTAAAVTHAAEETGPGLLKEVAAKSGSIGYANLADAVNNVNGGFNGVSPSKFWVALESSKKEKETSKGLKITRKYIDPIKGEESNCKDTVFTNEAGVFPPPTVDSPWNEVTAKSESKTYALCGLTYDLVLTDYEAYSSGTAAEKGTAAEAQSVIDFENYVLSSKGGAKEIKHHYYTALPKELVPEAVKGVELITG